MTRPNEKKIVYTQDGTRKTISESQAIYMLENIAKTDMQKALGHYLTLTDQNPHADLLLKKFYGTLLHLYMFEEMLKLSSARLSRMPGCATSLSAKVDALQHMCLNEQAIEILETATAADPENIININKLGALYKDVGNFDEARACFDKVIKLNPLYAPSYWHRVEFSLDPEADLVALEKLISERNVAEDQTHFLHFGAYRLSEKLGRFKGAFEHLQIANTMKRRTLDHDAQREIETDNMAKSIFDAKRMSSLEPAQKSELRPIFIMGMPRSGTTLVEQIIASHSDVAGGDECTAFSNATARAHRRSKFDGEVHQWLSTIGGEDYQRIAKFYESNMRYIRRGKTVFTDKNQFNYRSIGLIKASLANAKIIVVERNPMDVGFACYRQLFGGDGVKFSYQIDELTKAHASYMSLIDHWESVTTSLIKRVQYEDLVKNQQSETNAILDFCGLSHEPSCLEFQKTERVVKTLSAAQVRQPMFTHDIDRWKHYEQQLQPMLKSMQQHGLI